MNVATLRLGWLVLIVCVGCSGPQPVETTSVPQRPVATTEAPRMIEECERSDFGNICGTWTLSGEYYLASWRNGATATLRIVRFDQEKIIITRHDTQGSSAGLTARYEAKPFGRSVVDGNVVWNWHWGRGKNFDKPGTWTANW